MHAIALLFAALAPVASPRVEPDRILLRDGRSIECRVLMESAETVAYREGRKQHEVARSEVVELRSIERSLATFVERFASVDRDDVAALSALADQAAASELGNEARNLWMRVLTLDPTNERAWTAADGVKTRKVWRFDLDGERCGIETLRDRGADPRHPLVLRTSHFIVASDLPLTRVLDATLDLERTYLAFYGLLGSRLDLYVFDESPVISIFSDTSRQPSPPRPGDSAWFDPVANTLYIRASPAGGTREIVTGLVDVMLFNSFCRSAGTRRTGIIDGWGRSGLAQLFASAVRGDSGSVTFDFETPYAPQFRLQAREPVALERLLGSGPGAFDAGPDDARFEAAAYTLVHFLAHADGAKRRTALGAYTRAVFLGRGGPTQFKTLFGDSGALEAEWQSYVRHVAGI